MPDPQPGQSPFSPEQQKYLNDLKQRIGVADTKAKRKQIKEEITALVDKARIARITAILDYLNLPYTQRGEQVKIDFDQGFAQAFPDLQEPVAPPKPTLAEPEEAEDLEDLIPTEYIDEVFVPPDEIENRALTKERQEKTEEIEPIARYRLAAEVLKEMGVDLRACQGKQGKITEKITRDTSYRMIVATEIGKIILTCDEEGNRSFVVYSTEDPDQYWRMSKQELLDLKGKLLQDLAWSEAEDWKDRLKQLLEQDSADIQVEKYIPEEYYRDSDYVRHDLEAYAKTIGKMIEELSSYNIKLIRVICANGEPVQGATYILRAGVALGLAKNSREAQGKRSQILKEHRLCLSRTLHSHM